MSAARALPDEFTHRTIRLINRGIGISGRTGVGVGNRDWTMPLPTDHMGTGAFRDIPRIIEGVVFVRVTVRPTIDDDGRDILVGIESAWFQSAAQLIPDMSLEYLEAGPEQLGATRPMLISLGGGAGQAGRTEHEDHDRIIGRTRP